ncbi:MAG TPA: AcvB/VirJ family lysyl-phosphatidylglycerol hydrolase [Gemmatimonadaceae bacterium]|nr:AcvB/VirJ family lysyl-phosphatidylglycerol hydrolase [Gemmatimonadaceae bacterium]
MANLPLVARPPRVDSGSTLVVLLTGDGGWAAADEKVAAALLDRGAAVLGVNMRAYLTRPKTPDEAAADIGCAARAYIDRWRRTRLMLLGYSRGADIAPFVVARWPDDLKQKLNLVALVSMSTHANFHFRLIDLVRDVKRSDDLPVVPELARLVGIRVVCIYGSEEKDSGCRAADPALVTKYERKGGHRLTGGFADVARVLEQGLKPLP